MSIICGLSQLIDNPQPILGKKVGILCNQTATVLIDNKVVHIVDALLPFCDIKVVFGPEHGYYQNTEDQIPIEHGFIQKIKKNPKDENSKNLVKIPIISLFDGDFFGIDADAHLEALGVEILIYDIQDVGMRFYTFITHLYLAMYACFKKGITLMVLDRPNPLGIGHNEQMENPEKLIESHVIEGPLGITLHSSFICCDALLPLRYGMTVGELANFMKNEFSPFKLFFNEKQDNPPFELQIIKMKDFSRSKSQWGIDFNSNYFTAPSPNIPNLETALIYPGTCLFEGTNVSEGRGTQFPFLLICAPFFTKEKLENILKNLKEIQNSKKNKIWDENYLKIDILEKILPISISGVVSHPKYENEECWALKFEFLELNDLNSHFSAIRLTVILMFLMKREFFEEIKFLPFLDSLWGNEDLRFALKKIGKMTKNEEIVERFEKLFEFIDKELVAFERLRREYLFYPQ